MKNLLRVSSSKGQMKIQQMAFVLVAIFIFFSMVALFFISIQSASLRQTAGELAEEKGKEIVIKLASTPEFAWESGISSREDCLNCVDFDKLLALKEIEGYEKLWGLDYIAVRTFPLEEEIECTKGNYPNCNTVTIVEKDEFKAPQNAFIALCREVPTEQGSYRKCEVGKIYVSGKIK